MKIVLEDKENAVNVDLSSEILSKEKKDMQKEFKTKQNYLKLCKNGRKVDSKLLDNSWEEVYSNDIFYQIW